MAITIRNIEEHEKMFIELKKITSTKTMSSALIKGGYDAINYKRLYEQEQRKNQELSEELYSLKTDVSDFVDSFETLKRSVE